MNKVLVFGIVILLFIGVNVFASFAWKIEGNEVAFIQSLLPAAFVFIALFVWKCLASNISTLYKEKKQEFHILMFLVLVVLLKLLWGHSSFLGGIINVLLIPVLLSILIPTKRAFGKTFMNRDLKRLLIRTLIWFYVIECSVAIIERLLLTNFFPLNGGIADGLFLHQLETAEFRSTALVNHPLQNALSVSIIMSFLLVSNIKDIYKYSLWFLGFLAVLCFNTRSSIFAWICLLSLFFIYTFFIDRKVSVKAKSILFACCVFIVLGISYMMFEFGWGARLLNLGLIDDGSSIVRVKIWDVFESNSFNDFLFGHDNFEIKNMIRRVGVSIIENYWLIYLFTYGLLLTIGLTYYFTKLFGRLLEGFSFFPTAFVLSCFLLISSTNNSLAVPSPAIAIFILCCYVFNTHTIDKRII